MRNRSTLVGGLLGADNAPAGILSPEFYNQLGHYRMRGVVKVMTSAEFQAWLATP
jgi:hypothetical protein